MDYLQDRIKEAEQAAQERARQEALIADLPRLQEEQRRQEAYRQAMARLDETRTNAQAELAELTPQVKAWRERFEGAVAELEALAGELPDLENRVWNAGYNLRDAVIGAGEGISGFTSEWESVGGTHADLAPFPPLSSGSMARKVYDAMRERVRGVVIYFPNRGARPFVRGR